jgi:hypothetical protein
MPYLEIQFCGEYRIECLDEGCIQQYGRKTEEEKPFGRRRHRWEDNIETNFKEIGCENKLDSSGSV